jgi:hypothetical protein
MRGGYLLECVIGSARWVTVTVKVFDDPLLLVYVFFSLPNMAFCAKAYALGGWPSGACLSLHAAARARPWIAR